jgi:hypothetical protein
MNNRNYDDHVHLFRVYAAAAGFGYHVVGIDGSSRRYRTEREAAAAARRAIKRKFGPAAESYHHVPSK